MSDQDGSTQTVDPFSQFWTEMMGRMGAAGAAGTSGASDEWLKQMRRPFFDAMARQAEQFMRSEQFLAAMKQSMDNALAAKQQVNQFLTKTLEDFQMPSSSDMDHVVLVVRGMEERICDKLDALSERVDRLERPQTKPAAATQIKAGVRLKAKPKGRKTR